MNLQAGQIVEFQGKDPPVQLGVVLAVTPKGVRLLQLNRRETTVTERTILHHTARARVAPADLDECWEKARRCDEKRQGLAAVIDLAELHELLAADARPYGLHELAGFLGETGDEDMEAALLRRLAVDAFYFRQRKEGYLPNPVEEVRTALERDRKRQQQEVEDQALADELKRGAAGTPLADLPRVAGVLDALVQIVLWGDEAQVPKRLHEVLERAGLHQARPLFTFLVRVGRFSATEHLDLLRYKVPISFPDGLELMSPQKDDARVAPAESSPVSSSSGAGRRDCRGLRTWAIDAETTRDRDDAFSLSVDGESFTLWVHISDVAGQIPPDSPLDREAHRRGTTIYLPERTIPMLPPSISEEALSLSDAGDRPALTCEIRLGPDGTVHAHEMYRSLIRVSDATNYLTADQLLNQEPLLAAGVRLAGLLRERRRQGGALFIRRQPELKPSIALDGRIELGCRPDDSPTSDMIMEFMILTNHLAARLCRAHGLPCLYRSQEPSEAPPDLPEGFQPVAFFRALRLFRKTVLGLTPGHHGSLGVGPYCQITSPLRRYSDLLIQRQVLAHLDGLPLPYDADAFSQALQEVDESVRIAETVMRNRHEYWLLAYLRQELDAGRDAWPGVVVDQSPTEMVVYFEAICEFRTCRRPAIDVAVGQRVTLRVKKADPFDGLLRFEVLP